MLKKARLFLVIAVILSFLYPMRYCFALSDPHIVVEEEVWLLDKQSGSRLFILQKPIMPRLTPWTTTFIMSLSTA